jgi:uncharacterized protein HemY
MWLPTPIYEKTPQMWLLMAVLFVVLALYIGFGYKFTIPYVLLGLFCAGRGIQVWRMRSKFRRAAASDPEASDDTLIEAAGNY